MNINTFTGTNDQRVRWGYRYKLKEHNSFDLLRRKSNGDYEVATRAIGDNWTEVRQVAASEFGSENFYEGTVIGFNSNYLLIRGDNRNLYCLPIWAVEALTS